MRTRRGVAILIALGALTFLSCVGVSFTIGSILSLKTAYNYYYAAKAELVADAGISRAIAELRCGSIGATTDAVDIADTSYDNGTIALYTETVNLNRGLTGAYNVTVVDCASRINLNDTDNTNLIQILKNLSNTSSPALLTDSDCENIVDNRPSGGYSTKEQVKLNLSGATRQAIEDKYNAIAEYITVCGYIDPLTVNPTDLSSPYAIQKRSPINVNTASKEVLRAVLTGIRAVHACPKCGGDGTLAGTSFIGPVTCDACSGGTLTISSAEAQSLALWIAGDGTSSNPAHRPYSNWSQFYASIKSCSSIGTMDADLVMANACPNTGFSWIRNAGWAEKMGYLGKYLIDWNKNGLADESDKGLIVNTTEFSFNSGGYYEVTSSGEVSHLGLALAHKNIFAIVKIFDQNRITSQQQFEASGSSKTNVTTYPEPVEVEDLDLRPAAAAYDGQIMLAKKTAGGPDSSGCTSWFNAPYKVSLDALSAGGNKTLSDVKASGSGTKPNIGSVVGYENRGDLMPDGMLTDMFDKVNAAYKCPGNVVAGNGTLEIWFKTQWNSRDSMMYGDVDVDRKMFRLTSGSALDGFTDPNGVPFVTLSMWSDGGGTYAQAKWNGGAWNPSSSEWSYVGGSILDTSGWTGSNFKWGDIDFGWRIGGRSWGHWDAGKWNHLAVTWTNPSSIKGDPEGTYTSALCPIYIYLNGEKKLFYNCGRDGSNDINIYYYHPDYENKSDIDYDFMCGNEYSKWNTAEGSYEFSNSVIGSVWIWDSQRSDYEITADMNNGIYVTSGTYESPEINFGKEVLLGTVTWTQAVPDEIADEGGGITVSVDTTGAKTSWTGDWTDPSAGRAINTVTDKLAVKAKFTATGTETVEELDNVLLNGGFEDGSLSNWTVVSGNNVKVTTKKEPVVNADDALRKPHNGLYYLYHERNSETVAYQEVACAKGAKYKLSAWYSWYHDNWNWHGDLELKFYDSSGTLCYSTLDSTTTSKDVGSDYICKDLGWVAAPASATKIRAGIRVYGSCIPTENRWDDFVLQQSAVSTTGVPALETPVLEDITITYLPKTEILYCREF
ncbi:MAG: hypothetical protein WC316_02000 [Candidatus Omnitrophota bacterium]|jgi:hypothetical protein